MSEFDHVSPSTSYGKLQSRLSHILNRLDANSPLGGKRAEVYARTLSMLDALERKGSTALRCGSPEQATDLCSQVSNTSPIRRLSGLNELPFQCAYFK